jgi:Icc-related predicted phosphoesterase
VSLWLFTSDLHGHPAFYVELVRLCADRHPAVVILGGDLAPHGSGAGGIAGQREFFAGPFRAAAGQLAADTPGLRLFVILGNDDWRASLDPLETEDGGLWRLLHGRAVPVEEEGDEPARFVAGLSWVPPTPFVQKDWERWDTPDAPPGWRAEGVVSDGGGLRPVRLDGPVPGETIADALAELGRLSPPERTVYCLHSPPYDTLCDVIPDGSHVGSRAIRRFLERAQPPLVLSGHVHESPRLTGAYRDRIGRTLVVNPGQFEGKRFCAVTFDVDDPGGTLWHTVRG